MERALLSMYIIRFCQAHAFQKPNDPLGLQLMTHAATQVMEQAKDIIMAFGESDEYSFVFRKSTTYFERREDKILTTITSIFSSSYVFYWEKYFKEKLKFVPSFDGRIILYPDIKILRDYFSWRQVDTHVNNLYNTTFWALVLKGGKCEKEAHEILKGSNSGTKNEILHEQFKINYNNEPQMYKKGTTLLKEESGIMPYYEDIIANEFWDKHNIEKLII